MHTAKNKNAEEENNFHSVDHLFYVGPGTPDKLTFVFNARVQNMIIQRSCQSLVTIALHSWQKVSTHNENIKSLTPVRWIWMYFFILYRVVTALETHCMVRYSCKMNIAVFLHPLSCGHSTGDSLHAQIFL